MPTRQQRVRFTEFDRIHEKTVVSAVKKISKIYREAEAILSDYHQRAIDTKDEEMERDAFWMRIAIAEMTGRGGREKELLAQQHQKYPDLRSKLAILNHLIISRDNYREALALARKCKLPKNANQFELTNFFNVLIIRGKCELYLQRFTEAARTMRRIADFIDKHIDRIQFFFDVHLAASLIEKRLALKDCRRYLEAIATRKQVVHDAKTTQQLLRRLGSNRRAKIHQTP
jgi:hypothetical protein